MARTLAASGLFRNGSKDELLEHALNLGVTRLDTATNYQRFTAHCGLAAEVGYPLRSFTTITKKGAFPEDTTLPRTCEARGAGNPTELGRLPNAVLAHNPESATGNFKTP